MSQPDHDRKPIDEMNRYYEARAPRHDDFMSYTSNDNMEARLKPIIEIVAKEVTGKRVLEIACGTGNWTQVLAKRAESIVAIDSSNTALEITRPKLTDYDNVTLLKRDAYELSEVGDSFEVMFSADWYSHIPKAALPHFLKTSATVLSPEARVIFLDMSFAEHFAEEPSFADQDNNRVSLRQLDNGREYRVIKNFPSENELRTTLDRHGTDISYYNFLDLLRWMVIYSIKRVA